MPSATSERVRGWARLPFSRRAAVGLGVAALGVGVATPVPLATEQYLDGQAWAVLSVRDEGIGIPAGELAGIFERFGRASHVVCQLPGTGLGLWSARHLVEQHGGTVSATSREGAGATFVVRLPLATASETMVGG